MSKHVVLRGMTLSYACRRLAGRYVAYVWLAIAIWSQSFDGHLVLPTWLSHA